MSFESSPWGTPSPQEAPAANPWRAVDTNPWAQEVAPPTPEAQESRFKMMLGLGKKATETIVAFQPESKLAKMSQFAESIPSNMTSFGGATEQVRGAFDSVKNDAQTAWENKSDILQASGSYAMNAGLEVGKQGLGAAMDVLKKDTGVSYERNVETGERELKVRKAKLAKFALKAAFTGGTSVVNTGRKAGTAGIQGVRKGAVAQVKDARSQALQSAKSYAYGQFAA